MISFIFFLIIICTNLIFSSEKKGHVQFSSHPKIIEFDKTKPIKRSLSAFGRTFPPTKPISPLSTQARYALHNKYLKDCQDLPKKKSLLDPEVFFAGNYDVIRFAQITNLLYGIEKKNLIPSRIRLKIWFAFEFYKDYEISQNTLQSIKKQQENIYQKICEFRQFYLINGIY